MRAQSGRAALGATAEPKCDRHRTSPLESPPYPWYTNEFDFSLYLLRLFFR